MTTIEIDDDAREVMFSELCDMLGEDVVRESLADACGDYLTEMYDHRDKLAKEQSQ